MISLVSVLIFADVNRIAVSDFLVHSNNPKYEFMGKGISEMIAVELRKSPGIDLVERENRIQLVKEMEFSLSDLADPATQVRVGKLLAATYILFGEIVDMDEEMLISLRMAEVLSGKVVWKEKLVEKLTNYDFITGYFAGSILRQLNLEVTQTTTAKVEVKKVKSEEAIIALSKAIGHYDRQERDAAKKELAKTERIDPESEAAHYYLAKLTVNTTKFTVMPEPYYSFQNPAYLGTIRTDTINFSVGSHVYGISTHNPIEYINYVSFADDKAIAEMDVRVHMGYAFPIAERFGMRVDALMYNKLDRYWQGSYEGGHGGSANRWGLGGIVDLGFKPVDNIAIGLGIGLFSGSTGGRGPIEPITNAEKAVISANLGFLYRNADESFVFDTRLGYSNESYDVIDSTTLSVEKVTSVPVFLENTFTFAFNERKTFFNLKQLNDLCLDRVYYYGRILPAIEHFFTDWFASRLGIEGSLAVLNDSIMLGYGILGGITFRIVEWHCDLDMNLTYRMRPSRVAEELLYPDFICLLSVSFNDVFCSRN